MAANPKIIQASSPIYLLLDRLTGIRQTGPDRWVAQCPAHDDRSPSLNLREIEDGTVLVKCWAGCGADAIVKSMGLSLRDLFPGGRPPQVKCASGNIPRVPFREVVETACTEAMILYLAYQQVSEGCALNEHDAERVDQAGHVIKRLFAEVIR
jgi:hypothetical protein